MVVAAVVLLAVDAAATLISIGFTPYDGIINVWDCGALLGTVGFAAAAALVWLLWPSSARLVIIAWVWTLVLTGLPFCYWLGISSERADERVVALFGAVMVVAPPLLLTLPLMRRSRR